MAKMTLQDRLERERQHGKYIIATGESNWGWKTPAGQIRWERRFKYLAQATSDPDAQVVEIGAGSGTFTVALADVYQNLTAIDISEDLLAIARSRAPSANFRIMDAHNLDFPDNSLDAVIGCSVLHHLDWNAALQTAYQKLKPGGVIRFSEPNLLNPQIFIQKNIPYIKEKLGDSPDEYAFTGGQIHRALKRAGFNRINVTPYEFLHPSTPPQWIDRVIQLENFISKTPLRHIGGSLLIEAWKA